MKLPELHKLAKELEEPAHLVIWQRREAFEVVAVKGDGFEDAFPLPLDVQSAAAEAEMILDTSTAARLAIEQMPEDFWESLVEVCYGEFLRVSVLGRPGQKYLQVYHAVNAGKGHDPAPLERLALTEGELLRVAKWIREHALFDHRKGDVIMEILTRFQE